MGSCSVKFVQFFYFYDFTLNFCMDLRNLWFFITTWTLWGRDVFFTNFLATGFQLGFLFLGLLFNPLLIVLLLDVIFQLLDHNFILRLFFFPSPFNPRKRVWLLERNIQINHYDKGHKCQETVAHREFGLWLQDVVWENYHVVVQHH